MIYQFEIFRNLTFSERKTFHIHLAYSIIEGIILGVLALNEFVFIKSMKGTSYQLSFLFQFGVIVMLFSVLLNEYLKRHKNLKRLLKTVAILTRVPLLFLILFPNDIAVLTSNPNYHFIFLTVFFIFFLAQPIILPLINLFLKNNYVHENFGRL